MRSLLPDGRSLHPTAHIWQAKWHWHGIAARGLRNKVKGFGRCGRAESLIRAGSRPVVVIDNYDSFTYNLCQYLGNLNCHHVVFKNDEKTVEEIEALEPRGILISPGPGRPEDSGISLEMVRRLGPVLPMLGVCMGHQCIGQVFGGRVVRAPGGVMHGKTSPVFHTNAGIMQGLDSPFRAARYHSLVVEQETFPPCLEMTAWTEDGLVMGLRHREYPSLQGVQFHPESIITTNGMHIVANFVETLN